MPSFDIVSKIDSHELTNAIDQANREVINRFDFKGSSAKFEFSEDKITMTAPNDFQLKQMMDILQNKLAKRNIDLRVMDVQKPEIALHEARQVVNVRQGIDKEIGKKILKFIKDSKLKVQPAIQGDQVRVTGKSRDDLQAAIAFMRESKQEIPLQYENFRD